LAALGLARQMLCYLSHSPAQRIHIFLIKKNHKELIQAILSDYSIANYEKENVREKNSTPLQIKNTFLNTPVLKRESKLNRSFTYKY
jgi:hypothetical protein